MKLTECFSTAGDETKTYHSWLNLSSVLACDIHIAMPSGSVRLAHSQPDQSTNITNAANHSLGHMPNILKKIHKSLNWNITNVPFLQSLFGYFTG